MAARELDTTLAVDKIFSLYTILLAQKSPLAQVPDYYKSTDAVFREATLPIMRLDSNLRCLSAVPGFQESTSSTSWSIDFGIPARRYIYHSHFLQSYKGNKFAHDWEISDDMSSLLIRGNCVDFVTQIALDGQTAPALFRPSTRLKNETLTSPLCRKALRFFKLFCLEGYAAACTLAELFSYLT
jgi:hypothetical protein